VQVAGDVLAVADWAGLQMSNNDEHVAAADIPHLRVAAYTVRRLGDEVEALSSCAQRVEENMLTRSRR